MTGNIELAAQKYDAAVEMMIETVGEEHPHAITPRLAAARLQLQKGNLADAEERYERALAIFVDRLKEDRWILGAVLQGSICDETIWKRDKIHLWIIEADGVTRRRRVDNEDRGSR